MGGQEGGYLEQGIYWSRNSGCIPKFGIFQNLARNWPEFRDNLSHRATISETLAFASLSVVYWTNMMAGKGILSFRHEDEKNGGSKTG